MIYLSVGTFHKGFDRLVKPLDNFCRINKIKCIAQIGGGDYLPKYMKYSRQFSFSKHLLNIKKSNLVISHGGYGTIMDLISLNKKFIVFPRNRNEAAHDQKMSIKYLKKKMKITACYSQKNLENRIMKFILKKDIKIINLPKSNIPKIIKNFINLSSL
ncbi:glycosyltransferase [Candidatus Pelagibacter sp. Uisw_130]|uniref:glycosyltransferase n=1 Tax=Candidatus Pelagibacter sp. Uisw_130 TaxID=3230989 RepID=UPI0039ED6953